MSTLNKRESSGLVNETTQDFTIFNQPFEKAKTMLESDLALRKNYKYQDDGLKRKTCLRLISQTKMNDWNNIPLPIIDLLNKNI